MSAYEETEDGLIRASLASRIGKLLEQYEPNANESYDATLTLVLLQALLTICHELLDKPPIELKKVKSMSLTDVPPMYGLGFRMISSFFPGQPQPTFYDVVDHLRHAVSHPLFPKDDCSIVETGFMAVNSSDRKIAAYRFVHSPDVRKGRNLNAVRKSDDFERLLEEQRNLIHRLPREIQSKVVEEPFEDRVEFQLDGELLQRVFIMEIPIPDLKEFVGALSGLLAKPLESKPEIAKRMLV